MSFLDLYICFFGRWTNYKNEYILQGDILFLHMSKEPIRAGEIVVFNVDVRAFIYFLLCYILNLSLYVW